MALVERMVCRSRYVLGKKCRKVDEKQNKHCVKQLCIFLLFFLRCVVGAEGVVEAGERRGGGGGGGAKRMRTEGGEGFYYTINVVARQSLLSELSTELGTFFQALQDTKTTRLNQKQISGLISTLSHFSSFFTVTVV